MSIPEGAIEGIPRFYVLCTHDRAIPEALQRRMIREHKCDVIVELETDHTPHLSQTKQLADAMLQFAERVAVV